jgi:outer membrane lipoprotein-sorting protein
MIRSQTKPDATLIVDRADRHMNGATSISDLTMKIVRPTWSREISLKSWTKGRELAMILITAPARDKGTTFLKRSNEVWNWLPSVERVIKIPPSMMMQSWLGSDFTNDDLVKESSIVNDYTHTIIGDSVIDNRPCYKIQLDPKPDAAVVWGRLYLWVTTQDTLELRVEYYDEDLKLINIMTLSDIKQMGDRVIPTRLEMAPVDKPDHKTVLIYSSVIYNKPIDDGFFSEQNMKRIH